MPNRTVRKMAKKLSVYYYSYGKYVASRTYLLLLFSLSFITYFSIPYLKKSSKPTITPTTHNNIPLSQISTSLDAQCWHASAHVQFNNITVNRHLSPTHYLITERIRLSHPDQPVSFKLIEQAKAIYESITTTIVETEDDDEVTLDSICYKHEGHCLIHAPPFSKLTSESDWREKTNINNQPKFQYESHPYSIYSNTTFDPQGELIKADAVLLTFVLKQSQSGDTLPIWNQILHQVKLKHGITDIQQANKMNHPSIWYASANTPAQMIQYKFNLFPYELSYKVQLSIIAYIIIFYLVSMAFGKSNLVKSGYTFGLAAVFLSIACFTTTWGIFIKLGISLNSVPWYLLLLSVNVSSLENIFLLTNAVLYAGCDMIVKEKVSRGLQSVGVPMTATLIAELFILSIGTQMDTALIKEFCRFTKVALCVDYVLEMTFVIAVLSIDIKRVELADLDDRQMSKRLHELRDTDAADPQQPDFCPVQDTPNKEESKSCAECKEFKTHRVFNALMLCFIVLLLSFFCSSKDSNHRQSDKSRLYQPDLNQLSDQFWSTVNPEKDITWLQIQPPHLLIYGDNFKRVSDHVEQLQQLYLAKSLVVRTKIEHRPSLFRMFVLSSLQNVLIFLIHINIPLLLLCLVTLGIITWMTPKWRDQWLLPLITRAFNQCILTLIRWSPHHYLRILYNFYFKGQSFESGNKEYDADGIHHRGAISVQNIFNQQQYRSNVKHVQVRTLTHQHIADIQNLDANAKQSLVSCGQDGRIVLWNVTNAKSAWMARLDRLIPARGGVFQATLNPEFYNNKKKKPSTLLHTKTKKKRIPSVSKNLLSKARCVKVDQGNKWIAAGFDDGFIRIWNVSTGVLLREMELHPHLLPSVEVQQEQSDKEVDPKTASNLRNRFNSTGFVFSSSNNNTPAAKKNVVDRILFVQFIGVIAEYCHPLVAEAAARCKPFDLVEPSQNYVISAHKSGLIHEWDILSGECIQTVKTGHTKDITQLLVVDSKAPHRKLGVTWVFTASKDGQVKCWERRLISQKDSEEEDYTSTRWNLLYTIKQNTSITSIASELPVGGMGVLITGCSDGSVRVWNFETGESICTLSLGKQSTSSSSAHSATSSVDNNYMIGGPIRKFSKFTNSNIQNELSSSSSEDEDSEEIENDNRSTGSRRRTSSPSSSDHRGSIFQVVVTRYCEVENGPGLCRGCDTCFGNGFLVASSSMDNKVHAWRLERSDNGHEGTCTLCTKDYHRKQYKHRKLSIAEEDGSSKLSTGSRRRRSERTNNSNVTIKKRHTTTTTLSMSRPIITSDDLSTLELLDIEQLAGDAKIPLKPTFLGKVDQPGGRGLVFCDKILAGVRRRRHSTVQQSNKSNSSGGEWETWFASLQYYDPTISKEEGHAHHLRIPIETFNLYQENAVSNSEEKKDAEHTNSTLKNILTNLFSPSTHSTAGKKSPQETMNKHSKRHLASDSMEEDESLEDILDDEDTLEAGENLPFSSVRHIIPLDGCGLACDFGNFIKVVHLDKPSLTEKERIKQTRDTMEGRPNKIVDQTLMEQDEEHEVDSGCQCDEDDNASCSTLTKGIDGCCGGANKEKNGGKCCGGSVKKQQEEKRRQRFILKQQQQQQQQHGTNSCGGVQSIADCSLKNNCSRAADCASNTAIVSNMSPAYSFNNWL